VSCLLGLACWSGGLSNQHWSIRELKLSSSQALKLSSSRGKASGALCSVLKSHGGTRDTVRVLTSSFLLAQGRTVSTSLALTTGKGTGQDRTVLSYSTSILSATRGKPCPCGVLPTACCHWTKLAVGAVGKHHGNLFCNPRQRTGQ
jgi:hypothetical protein